MNIGRANFGLNINISANNKDIVGDSPLGYATDNVSLSRPVNFTDGNGENQVDTCYHDIVALSTSTELNMTDSSLTDVFGTAINLSKLKALYVKNNTDSDLHIGGAAANQVGIVADKASDIIVVQPGGTFLWTAPDADGLDVSTDGTLKLDHQGTGSQEVEIIFAGVQT